MPITRRVTVSVSLPADLVTKVEYLSKETEESLSGYIRRSVLELVNREYAADMHAQGKEFCESCEKYKLEKGGKKDRDGVFVCAACLGK